MRKIILFLSITLFLSCSKDTEFIDLNTTNNSINVASLVPDGKELKEYFNIEFTQDIDQAINNIETIKELKKIGRKKILVENTLVETKDAKKGTIIVKISGKVDNNAFSRTYTFLGFIQSSYDSHIARNIKIKWKAEFQNNPEELANIDFDALYRLKKTDLFSIEYLTKWVDLYSTKPNTNQFYKFTSEDLKDIKIEKVVYDGYSGIDINLKYKNNESVAVFLKFDKDNYYKTKVSLNENEIKKYYAQGVYQNFNSFYRRLTNLSNENDFVLKIKSFGDSPNILFNKELNTISCEFLLLTKEGDQLAYFTHEFKGFKPLSDLSKELVVQTTDDLNLYMKELLKDTPDGDVTGIISKGRISLNLYEKTQFAIIRKDHIIDNIDQNLVIRLPNNQLALKLKNAIVKSVIGSIDFSALLPSSENAIHQDILLFNPVFKVYSAIKTHDKLIVELELKKANFLAIQNIQKTIEIKL